MPSSVKAQSEEEGTYTITILNSSNHEYEAYQIFSGQLENTSNGKSTTILSDIEWGEGVDSQQFLQELKEKESKFSNCKSAAEVSKVLSDEKNQAQLSKKFAKIAGNHLVKKSGVFSKGEGKSTISELKAGYYLLKDKENSVNGYDAYTDFVLKVVGNAEVNPKSSVPTVSKKVKENSKNQWQDGADYAIGSEVPFQLVGTLPKHWADYENYRYVFHDTLSAGLTLQEHSIRVFMKNGEIETPIDQSKYTIKTMEFSDQCTFEIQFENLKQIDGVESNSQIIVEYVAKLNEHAVIAGVGNPNEVYLEFSNNPNGNQTGKTPKDQVVVFTYELVVNKVDEKNQKLSGAAFSLFQMKNDQWESVKTIEGGETTLFRFAGLDAGKYKLVETKAPAGYNKMEDIVFTIKADYTIESPNPDLNSIMIEDEQKHDISTVGEIFKINLNPDSNNHNIVTDVVNKKGSTLPETGGKGTKGFYLTGGILIGIALIGFIKKSKQKQTKKED